MRPIEAICKKPDFWIVDKKRVTTAPFPGRYPTRWRVLFHGKITDYQVITKPNPLIINSIMRVVRHVKGVIEIQEFDQAGAFRSTQKGTPRKTIGPNATNHRIFGQYYPWHGCSDEVFFEAWNVPVWSKLVKYGKRSFFVYSPYEVMWNEAGFPRLRDYKTWLRKERALRSLI